MIYGTGRDRTVAVAARFIRRFGVYPVYGETLGGGEALSYRDMITKTFAVLERSPQIINVPGLPYILALAGAVFPGSELRTDFARRMN